MEKGWETIAQSLLTICVLTESDLLGIDKDRIVNYRYRSINLSFLFEYKVTLVIDGKKMGNHRSINLTYLYKHKVTLVNWSSTEKIWATFDQSTSLTCLLFIIVWSIGHRW
jgi:hypothetical protein